MTSSRFRRIATLIVAVLFVVSIGAMALSGSGGGEPTTTPTAATR